MIFKPETELGFIGFSKTEQNTVHLDADIFLTPIIRVMFYIQWIDAMRRRRFGNNVNFLPFVLERLNFNKYV